MAMSMLSSFSSVSIIPMSFTILAFFFIISLGDLLSCFMARGVLLGLPTLMVDKVNMELVGLGVLVLLLLSLQFGQAEQFIFTKLRLVLNITKQFKHIPHIHPSVGNNLKCKYLGFTIFPTLSPKKAKPPIPALALALRPRSVVSSLCIFSVSSFIFCIFQS